MTARTVHLPDLLHPRTSAREITLWAGAGALVLTVYAALYYNAPGWQANDALHEQGATAIMIDLAPMAVAPDAVPSDIAELVDSQEAISGAPPTETIAQEPAPQDIVETTPATELEPVEPDVTQAATTAETAEPLEARPLEPEVVEEMTPELLEASLPEIATALPTPRPDIVEPEAEPKPAAKKPAKKAVKKAPLPRSSVASRASANDAPKAAAPRPREGSKAQGESPARWQSRVNAHLNRHKRYPASERSTGQAAVRFSIDPSGRVLAASLARSSGNGALDQAAIEMVRRASPLPPPPPAIARSRLTLTVPVRFSRR